MGAIHKIKEPLNELNDMIGMNALKNSIVDQIIYFVQELHISSDSKGDFMHTCIYGPPGTGKTEIAKIMGKIYSKMGILKKNKFKKVTRADLIAGFLGQTSLKTKEVISECLGGVLFIDEAYALGNREKRDSFAKECIDTICEALSDHKEDLMVIIAGYKEDLQKCFFAYNQGLDSRFTWRFKTDDYTPEELQKIFIKKVNDANWKIKQNNVHSEWFETNKDYFKFFGRDMETLFAKVKIAHSRRVFCLSNDIKKVITDADLKRGFEMFLENDEVKNRKDDFKRSLNFGMYS
jgi:SpoVK/Ycf46/Vps4 family AAA+-type ATPase